MSFSKYNHDNEAQRFLRETVNRELLEVLHRHNCGGVLITVSKEAGSWITVLPEWGALQPDTDPTNRAGMRFKAARTDPDQHEKAELGLHFIKVVKDVSGDVSSFYSRFFRQLRDNLTAQGVEMTEWAVNSFTEIVGHRPDPMGGKVD